MAVMVDPDMACRAGIQPVVIDATLAKKNLGLTRNDAPWSLPWTGFHGRTGRPRGH
jgi:hypothetical protein